MAQQIRKMPVKVQELELTGDYVGWKFTARTNPPMLVVNDMISGNLPRMIVGLSSIVHGWNFCDEQGAALPTPDSIRQKAYTNDKGDPLGADEAQAKREAELFALIGSLPIDLIKAMDGAFTEVITKVDPN